MKAFADAVVGVLP